MTPNTRNICADRSFWLPLICYRCYLLTPFNPILLKCAIVIQLWSTENKPLWYCIFLSSPWQKRRLSECTDLSCAPKNSLSRRYSFHGPRSSRWWNKKEGLASLVISGQRSHSWRIRNSALYCTVKTVRWNCETSPKLFICATMTWWELLKRQICVCYYRTSKWEYFVISTTHFPAVGTSWDSAKWIPKITCTNSRLWGWWMSAL